MANLGTLTTVVVDTNPVVNRSLPCLGFPFAATDLPKQPCASAISGNVVSKIDGVLTPVSGAFLTLYHIKSRIKVATAVTDDSGAYEITGLYSSPEAYRLICEAPASLGENSLIFDKLTPV